ncbi:hypothetical protein AHAS_Ahas20G0258200 [Arachis hypogaea]
MAPKVGELSSRKRKEKTPSTIPHEVHQFYTKVYEEHYYKIISKKKVIPEVKFVLKANEYPEIQEQIRSRGWEVLANPVIEVGVLKRSILPTCNRSEVTVGRAVMIHCIMLRNEVEVHHVIPLEIYNIIAKPSTLSRLAFSHLISRLCEAANVQIDRDMLIAVDRPITKMGMEYTRELGQAPPQAPILPPQKEHLEIPQGQDLPPREYFS